MHYYRPTILLILFLIMLVLSKITYGQCTEDVNCCSNTSVLSGNLFLDKNYSRCYCYTYDTTLGDCYTYNPMSGGGLSFNTTGSARITQSQCSGDHCNITLQFYDKDTAGNISTTLTTIFNASTYTQVCDERLITVLVPDTASSASSSGSVVGAPAVSSINITNGVIGNTITTFINGSNFASGVTVKLVKGGNTIPVAVTAVTSVRIDCNIDLTGVLQAQVGSWDMVITNPDGKSVTLPGVFLVESGVTPDIKEVTLALTNNIITVTITGDNFIPGVIVEIVNGGITIPITIQEITKNKIVGVVEITNASQIDDESWLVRVTNPDQKSTSVESVRIQTTGSSTPPSNSWLAAAIAVPVAAAASAAVASTICIVWSYKNKVFCFKKAETGVPLYTVGGDHSAAPIYDL